MKLNSMPFLPAPTTYQPSAKCTVIIPTMRMRMFIIQEIFTNLLATNNNEVINWPITTLQAKNTPKGANPILFKNRLPKSFTSLPVKIPCKLWERKIVATPNLNRKVSLNISPLFITIVFFLSFTVTFFLHGLHISDG